MGIEIWSRFWEGNRGQPLYAIMGNHFHLLVEVSPGAMLKDEEVRRRFQLLYGKEVEFPE